VGEQTPLGDRWSTLYDTRDFVQALVDPLGNRTSLTWNARGGLTEIIPTWVYAVPPGDFVTKEIRRR